MSGTLTNMQSPPSDQQTVRAQRARWWLWLVIGLIAPLTLLAAAILAVLAYFQAENARAAAAVKAEVARIQAAGEPITTADLYAYHRVPAGVPDLTQEWLAVLDSFDIDAENLPYLVSWDDKSLDPDAPDSQFSRAQRFLQKYNATLQAALAVAKKPGECRFRVEFEQGIAVLLRYVGKVRPVSRLLALDVRTKAYGGDVDGAVSSAEAMFGVPRAMQRQIFLVEQLQSMATLAMALKEVEFLLNHVELTDEQLARLAAQVASIDVQGGLTSSMLGERAMGYQTFHHPEQLAAMQGSGTPPPPPGEGHLSRPADCQFYLELLGEMVAASREPFPDAQTAADKVEHRLKTVVGSQNPLEKLKYMNTALLTPATRSAFTAAASRMAERDLILAALAAERQRLKTGSYPASLADLVPEFLPAVPSDPFDGKPLRMMLGDGELTLYSIGKNQRDDGGLDSANTGELDIVVQVREKKGT